MRPVLVGPSAESGVVVVRVVELDREPVGNGREDAGNVVFLHVGRPPRRCRRFPGHSGSHFVLRSAVDTSPATLSSVVSAGNEIRVGPKTSISAVWASEIVLPLQRSRSVAAWMNDVPVSESPRPLYSGFALELASKTMSLSGGLNRPGAGPDHYRDVAAFIIKRDVARPACRARYSRDVSDTLPLSVYRPSRHGRSGAPGGSERTL